MMCLKEMQSIENEILCICHDKLRQLDRGMQRGGWYFAQKRNGVDLQLSGIAVVPQA